MRTQLGRWKSVGMSAVLGVVVYQGFLASTKFEVAQTMDEVGCRPLVAREVELSHRAVGNSAPLYDAAVRLQEGRDRGRGQWVSLEEFRKNRAGAEQHLSGQQVAFDLVRQASQRRRYSVSYSEARNQVSYLGYRSLVQAACLQMMRLSEAGEFAQATALAKDIKLMIERMENYPTVMRHVLNLNLTEQLARTIQELHAAYPGQGWEKLAPDLNYLRKAMDRGLVRSVWVERALVAGLFDEVVAGDNEMLPGSAYLLACELQVYQAKLAYLRGSQQIEEALATRDQTKIAAALEKIGASSTVAAAMTPNWARIAERHQAVVKDLGPSF